jgi:Bacterial Ig-like domain (group 3)
MPRCNGIVITDQRGVARPQGAACDIGALELVVYSTVLTPAGVTPASIVAGSPGPVTLSTTLTTQDTDTPIPGGTIAFSIDGASVGNASTDSTGAAAISYYPSPLQAGTHTVEAFFAKQLVGDVAFDASTSAPGTFQLEPSPYVASVQPPIKADGTSVFNLNRGVV